ncbi:hypothetical protein H6P81_012338 [Aristolochia fimbriata]|uniref:Uncharacterized protein n=1 Tax=Aristolochia fimbriata TaxID=158543 RepID=A0AAV7EBJ3_ARIFI|nr:hypothetical protein H6P81_012338 [Aristolochia fimbriata]
MKEEQSARRKPWETKKGIVTPENIKVSFSFFDGGHRWYLDIVSLRGEIVVKLAKKSATDRSYVRFPVGDAGEVRKMLLQLASAGTPGKTAGLKNGAIEAGIYEKDDTLVWTVTEKRGKTTMGSVSIPRTANKGKGWAWLEECLAAIQAKVDISKSAITTEAKRPPRINKVPLEGRGPRNRTFKEVLCRERSEEILKKRPVEVELIQGAPILTVQKEFTTRWLEELLKCVIIKTKMKQQEKGDLVKIIKDIQPLRRSSPVAGDGEDVQLDLEQMAADEEDARPDLEQLAANHSWQPAEERHLASPNKVTTLIVVETGQQKESEVNMELDRPNSLVHMQEKMSHKTALNKEGLHLQCDGVNTHGEMQELFAIPV